MKESAKRSVAKAASFRVIGTFTNMIIVFVLSGNIAISLTVGILDVIFKTILYFAHERIWSKITWGYEDD